MRQGYMRLFSTKNYSQEDQGLVACLLRKQIQVEVRTGVSIEWRELNFLSLSLDWWLLYCEGSHKHNEVW
jgi:hypothetical protein